MSRMAAMWCGRGEEGEDKLRRIRAQDKEGKEGKLKTAFLSPKAEWWHNFSHTQYAKNVPL